MVWSISFSGTPEKVVEALAAYELSLIGVERSHFANAAPLLRGLVGLHYSTAGKRTVELVASGGESTDNGKPTEGFCSVQLRRLREPGHAKKKRSP